MGRVFHLDFNEKDQKKKRAKLSDQHQIPSTILAVRLGLLKLHRSIWDFCGLGGRVATQRIEDC